MRVILTQFLPPARKNRNSFILICFLEKPMRLFPYMLVLRPNAAGGALGVDYYPAPQGARARRDEPTRSQLCGVAPRPMMSNYSMRSPPRSRNSPIYNSQTIRSLRRPREERASWNLKPKSRNLQSDIGHRNAEFRARTQPVTLDAVRGAIPADTALVEIFAYQTVLPEGKINLRILSGNTLRRLCVEAAVGARLSSLTSARLRRLTPTSNSGARRYETRSARTCASSDGVWTSASCVPFASSLASTKRLFISPDGALNLIPFAALVDENNKYLWKHTRLTI